MSGCFTNVCKTTRTTNEIDHISRSTGNSTTYRNVTSSRWMTKGIALMCKSTLDAIATSVISRRKNWNALFFYMKEIQILQASHKDCFDV